ncbi:MAG: malate dehydrogenase, partial [Actinobacteria bacterium]|nr:malate dehydrogenase [Actinomycetota bacterium]
EMTYLAYEYSGFNKNRVMGMAGVLDTSRFFHFLDKMGGLASRDVNAMVLGTHGDDMVPLTDWSQASGTPLSDVVESESLEDIIDRTRKGGAEIVGHLKTGSAYFAPAVSIGITALSVLGDTGRVLPVSAYMDGQYGIAGIFFGVPSRLGRDGVLEIIELPLSAAEREMLVRAAGGVESRLRELRSLSENESS